MKSKNKVSVLQFFICLFLCNMFFTFGFMKTGGEKNSLTVNVIFGIVGVILLILSCVPSYMTFCKTGKTTIELVSLHRSFFSIFVKIFYLFCFIVFTCSVVTSFAKFMNYQINSDATPIVIVFIYLLLGALVSYKGMQPLFRVAIIVFAFAVFSVVFIFGGVLDLVDFENLNYSSLSLNSQITGAVQTIFLSVIPVTAYVVFSDSLKGNQKLGIFNNAFFTFLIFVILGFFTTAVMGEYSSLLDYPSFILAKLSKISVLKGGEGMLFAVVTASAFLLVYLFFTSAAKTVEAYHSKAFSIAFSLISFILSAIMLYVPAVYSFVASPVFLSVSAIIAAVIIPAFTYVFLRKVVS